MGKRIKIGLLFLYDEQWMGGTYYIMNLIEALKTVDDPIKPVLKIVVNSSKEEGIIKQINYPHTEIVFDDKAGISLIKRGINYLGKKTFNQHLFRSYPKLSDCVAVFPVFSTHVKFYTIPIYWIPDFQELFYPDFFSKSEIARRVRHHLKIASNKSNVVFSSQDACANFNSFYPNNQSIKYVLHFAVTHPSYQHLNQSELLLKYALPADYFIAPNQFWKHKNHQVVIEAAKILKQKNIPVCIVFTGKEDDNRNPGYADDLKKIVEENDLKHEIRFLGFIDRTHLLKLMENAIAVIQPSLFEGWSTVIEDAKAMNQFVISSSIKVNKEQISDNVLFFDPSSALDLSEKIMNFPKRENIIPETFDYQKNVYTFGNLFIKLANQQINK